MRPPLPSQIQLPPLPSSLANVSLPGQAPPLPAQPIIIRPGAIHLPPPQQPGVARPPQSSAQAAPTTAATPQTTPAMVIRQQMQQRGLAAAAEASKDNVFKVRFLCRSVVYRVSLVQKKVEMFPTSSYMLSVNYCLKLDLTNLALKSGIFLGVSLGQ